MKISEHADMKMFTESRQALAADPHRPLYHFSPPQGVMNDPNGLCFWQGRYHLFYQLKPDQKSEMHWGHTVSDDLIHWRDMPIALRPDIEERCFSGQCLVEEERVIAIYHGVPIGNCIAEASDPLLTDWKRHPANPVIPAVPIDNKGNPYRVFDPCIWKETDGYYALSGTYKNGEKLIDCIGVDHLFRSSDLERWEYLGPLVEGGFFTEPGEDAAVPNFLPIGNGKHILLFFSHKRAAQYYIGEYDPAAHRFKPDYYGRMNYGPFALGSLHAPSATIDKSGRLIAIFNVKEGKSFNGWSNVMSLPRCLSLDADNNLRIMPADEIKNLRFGHQRVNDMDILADENIFLDQIQGKSIEINAVIDPGFAREGRVLCLAIP